MQLPGIRYVDPMTLTFDLLNSKVVYELHVTWATLASVLAFHSRVRYRDGTGETDRQV